MAGETTPAKTTEGQQGEPRFAVRFGAGHEIRVGKDAARQLLSDFLDFHSDLPTIITVEQVE